MRIFHGHRNSQNLADFAVFITELRKYLTKQILCTETVHIMEITCYNFEKTHLQLGQTAMCLVSFESSLKMEENGVYFKLIT